MNDHEIMNIIEAILDDAKAGVLATKGTDGTPHMRWMNSAVLKGHPGVIFAVSSRRYRKVMDIEAYPGVEWMFQTRDINHIVNLRGKVNIIDNPSLKSEVLQTLGRRLRMFWKISEQDMDFVVLETVIEEATYFRPLKGEKKTVRFK